MTHRSVLEKPVFEHLIEKFRGDVEPGYLLDCTFGAGGHTAHFLESFEGTPHRVIALDRDPLAVQAGRNRFRTEIENGRLILEQRRFSTCDQMIRRFPVFAVLADLGFSSDQLDAPDRGFSFREEGPLSMQMGSSEMNAEEFLRNASETEIERILREYGNERFARRIAAHIVSARSEGELPRSTKELSHLIIKAIPARFRHGKIHAATRSFQAIRMAVNDEMGELDRLLSHAILHLSTGTRIAIISFHSVEDRRVKRAFNNKDVFRKVVKKPLIPFEEEVKENPRSRSAKLRVVDRI